MKKNPAWRRALRDEVAEEVCLSCFKSGETITGHRYFFFAPFLAAAFFGAGLLALDFTTFLAIMLLLSYSLTLCGMIGFSAANRIMCRGGDVVNDGNEIIFAPRG